MFISNDVSCDVESPNIRIEKIGEKSPLFLSVHSGFVLPGCEPIPQAGPEWCSHPTRGPSWKNEYKNLS